ncbi:MAG: heparinase II/III family protein [Clostridia bacterium]|nr:heparinase II/III family protein [Clostridia bacterium]
MYKRIISAFVSVFIISASVLFALPAKADDTVYHDVDGHFEIEAESLDYCNELNKVSMSDASGGYALQREAGSINSFTGTHDIVLNFNILKKGRYAFYLRLKTSGSYITYYTSIDSSSKTSFISKMKTGEYIYFPLDSYYLAEGTHTVGFTYRHCGYYIDKLVITNLSDDAMFEGESYDYKLCKNNFYNLPYDLPEVLENKVHPRLILEKDKLEAVRSNLTHPQNIKAYTRLLNACEKNYSNCLLNTAKANNANHDYLDYIEANAFLYALEKNPENAKKAINGIKDYLKTYRAAYASLTESREAGNTVFRASLVYDWCYDQLTDEDKNFIINECLLLFAASEHGRDGTHALNAYNSDHGEEYVLTKNMLGFSIATFDEIPHYFNGVYKRIIEEFVPSRNFRYENSDFNQQGDDYGLFRSGADSFMTLLLSNLDREDLVSDNQFMQAYQPIYRRNANGAFMREGDCYSFPILGGYQAPSGLTAITFIQSLLANDPYIKGEYFTITANSEANSLADTSISDAMYLALNDVTLLPKQKNDLPLSKYFGDKSGIMVARTSWDMGVNSNAMTVSMKVSERNMGGHGHSDSGHFYIYYKGPLAVDSGVYEPTSGNKSQHLNNYYRQTVAHNSVLIGGKGQKRISGIDTLSKMSSDTEYGEVLGYDFGEDPNKPDYTYLKGDLTKAYDGAAEEFTRSFMFFNFFDETYPGALVVFDKITSANETDEKTFLLHSQNEPEITGSRITIKNTTSYGYNGRLTNDVLLPAQNLKINKISGYIANGADYTVGKSHATGIGDESGNYRVEISSESPSKTEYRLNVLQVSENNDEIAPLEATLMEADGFFGAQIKDRVVLFSKDRNRKSSDVTFELGGDAVRKVTVCDLKAGKWDVYKDGTLQSSVTVYENGGVASFEGVGGSYVLKNSEAFSETKNLDTLSNLRDNPDYISVFRKSKVISSGGVTTSNFVSISPKPVMSENTVMVPIESVAQEFSVATGLKEDFIRVKKSSSQILEIYKNSPVINYNGKIFLADVPSFEKDGQWYVQSDALCGVLGCISEYEPLSAILYFEPSSTADVPLLLLGSSDEVLSECIFAKAQIMKDSQKSSAWGNIELYNHSGKDFEYYVCLALYDGDKLKNVKATKLICPNDKIKTDYITPEVEFSNDHELKLFVWKNDAITPVMKSVTAD